MDILSEQTRHLDDTIETHTTDLIALRRYLHANPELSREEFETTKLLALRLEGLGFSVRVREEGIGIIADLTPPGFDPETHPTVAIRADMDALPIHELNELEFASKNEGVMHACGHDVHMTCAFGASQALHELRDELPGRLRIVYQHAEETAPSGASEMVAFGAVDEVDAIIALHCDPELAAGKVGLKVGAFTASFDRFVFTIHGEGGHGARPHHCIDPIYVGTQLAHALYGVTSRRFDSRDPTVLSIGEFQAGHAPNVIPDSARLTGTIRTVSHDSRGQVEEVLNELAHAICTMNGATFDLDLYRGAPAIINNRQVVATFEEVATELLGPESIHWIPKPSMGSEDFSDYLQRVPGAMFRLGTARADRPVHLLHSAKFDIDERAIGHGARILSRTALRLLHTLSEDRQALR